MDPDPLSVAMEQREELTRHKDALKDCIITGLKDMYFSESLCDVVILTANKRFTCHRVVLSSVSPYFRALFTCPMKESTHGEVCLSDVPSSIMQTVLDYIYTAEIYLTLDNVEELFIISSRLHVTSMQDLCSSYLAKKIDEENCLWIYRLAHSHYHRTLLEETVTYIGWNLSFFSQKEDFLHLELEELVTILSSDDLMVSSELDVYNVARAWWEFHSKEDNPLPTELQKVIRIPLLNPEELEKVSRDIPSDDSAFRCPSRIHLRQGMFEEKIICMDVVAVEETDSEEEDYYMNAYDPPTDSWEKLPFAGCLDNAGIVSVGCWLYVSGGFRKKRSTSNELHLYDSVMNEWKKLASMTHPRACHGFLVCGNALYALGGRNQHELTDTMECFNVSDNSWRSVSRMPLPLHSFTSAVLKGKLFVLGGMTTSGIALLHYPWFHIYEPLTDAWSKFPLPVIFSGAGAVTMDNQLYIIASYESKHVDRCASPSHDAYPPYDDYMAYLLYHAQPNATSKSFCMDHQGRICHSTIPPLLKSISGSAVVRWKHRIYTVGGTEEDGLNHYKMFHWSPGEPRWTLCKKGLTFLFSGLESVSLQVPLKHFYSFIPGRRSNYNFRNINDVAKKPREEIYWANW